MTNKMLRLTKDESSNPRTTGYAFAYSHKDRWEEMTGIGDAVDTYDTATTFLVKDDTVYTIYRDLILLDEGVRLYILKNRDLETDRIPEDEDETSSKKEESAETKEKAAATSKQKGCVLMDEDIVLTFDFD